MGGDLGLGGIESGGPHAPTPHPPSRAGHDVTADGDNTRLSVSLHGPGPTVEDAIEVALATKKLLTAVGREMGVTDVEWQIASVHFKCDGCGLQRPDRPRPDEGWTNDGEDDFCPSCTEERAHV